ncbi:MAG: amino acid racemase, partial [Woeseiaceae bacterium]|nr:amino acid racemase [Woeseiaceae bacterium]
MTRKTAGVLGGMGPDATVDFMAAVIALTPAGKDQDHVRMIIDHNPGVPDRQAAMKGDRSTVSRVLTEMALRLEAAGADFLVMPCNTAHVFLPEVLPKLHVPFINIVDETVAEIADTLPAAQQVGVMATNACIDAEVYQASIRASGRQSILPLPEQQQELMRLILGIKRGEKGGAVKEAMKSIAADLARRGADVIVAGCTEIPLVLGKADLDLPFISSTEVLA